MRVSKLNRAPRINSHKRAMKRRSKKPREVVSNLIVYHGENVVLPPVVKVTPVKTRTIGVQTDERQPMYLPRLSDSESEPSTPVKEEGKDNDKPTAHEVMIVDKMMNDPMFDGGFY